MQVVATDHAVFNSTQKRAGRHDFRKVPNGVNGIEERLHVTWNEMVNTGLLDIVSDPGCMRAAASSLASSGAGLISPSDFVRLVSTSVAQIFGIYPQKGHIAAGSDADIIILDPAAEHTITVASHHSAMDTNIYDGMELKGRVRRCSLRNVQLAARMFAPGQQISFLPFCRSRRPSVRAK